MKIPVLLLILVIELLCGGCVRSQDRKVGDRGLTRQQSEFWNEFMKDESRNNPGSSDERKYELAVKLYESARFAESLPIISGLAERYPENEKYVKLEREIIAVASTQRCPCISADEFLAGLTSH